MLMYRKSHMKTPQKYIFLDIDGLLNTGRNDFLNPDLYWHHFDNEAVKNLCEVVERTSAVIVVS